MLTRVNVNRSRVILRHKKLCVESGESCEGIDFVVKWCRVVMNDDGERKTRGVSEGRDFKSSCLVISS